MGIFISYRRDDSLAITGRIDDHLRAVFGDAEVFRDIDSIPAGGDFRRQIQVALERCELCVAIVGPHWLSERLREPQDFVRLELENVLGRRLPLIPVLVDRAALPQREVLPPSLHSLLERQALIVDSGADFRHHVRRLVQAIERALPPRAGVSVPPAWVVWLSGHALGRFVLFTLQASCIVVLLYCVAMIFVLANRVIAHPTEALPSVVLGVFVLLLGAPTLRAYSRLRAWRRRLARSD